MTGEFLLHICSRLWPMLNGPTAAASHSTCAVSGCPGSPPVSPGLGGPPSERQAPPPHPPSSQRQRAASCTGSHRANDNNASNKHV